MTKSFTGLEPGTCTITVQYTSSTCKDCQEVFTRTIEEAPCEEQCDAVDHDGDGNPYNGFEEPGETCDDGNPLTINDKVNNNCVCRGTPVTPVDCVHSAWTQWVCDGSTGTETRTRTIVSQPEYGGKACGPLEDDRPCDVDRYDLALNKVLFNNASTTYKA